MPRSYQRLAAWQEARTLVRLVYRTTADWPADERYGLVAQARRSAVSVVLNIAEGSARAGPREFRRYTGIALASLAELECTFTLARDVGIASQDPTQLTSQLRRTAYLLWHLHRSLRD